MLLVWVGLWLVCGQYVVGMLRLVCGWYVWLVCVFSPTTTRVINTLVPVDDHGEEFILFTVPGRVTELGHVE